MRRGRETSLLPLSSRLLPLLWHGYTVLLTAHLICVTLDRGLDPVWGQFSQPCFENLQA